MNEDATVAVERAAKSAGYPRWVRPSAASGIAGGLLLTITGLALFTVLNEAEFRIVDPLGAVAFLLLTVALPAFYVSERQWFTRLAGIGFGLFAGGWLVAAIALPLASASMPPVSEMLFLGFLAAVLAATAGAFVFGVASLRADESTTPRLSAWLFVLALPFGVPITYFFTTYVMGQFADPWAGPFVCFGVAWIVLGRHVRRRGAASPVQSESRP